MKKFLLAASLLASAAVASATAQAADLPYNWTGFYVGGNVGSTWQRLDNSLSITDDPPGYFVTAVIPGVNASGSPNLNASGVTAGGQFGFNQQVGNIVYGAEVDFNWLNLKKDTGGTFRYTTNNSPYFLSTSEKTQWLFTARPKIGYAVDRMLFYVTGGLAVASVKFEQAFGEPINAIPVRDIVSVTKTKLGWTAGLGGEVALYDAWTVKAEYLYAQFEGMDQIGQLTSAGGNATFSNSLSTLRLHTARVGLNYKFGP